MINGHAILSPSGSKKWMTCSGSAAMELDEENQGSVYSDEGTAAHALAAMCLEGNCGPEAFEKRVLMIVDGVYWDDAKGLPEKGAVTRLFTVGDDMIRYVGNYVRNIRKYTEGGTAYYEQALPIDHLTGEEGATGAGDVVNITADDELQVHDLKYGMGVLVRAEGNTQGLSYLSGAARKYSMVGPFKSYRFVIHQVRLDDTPDEWACTHAELMAFEKKASERAQIAWYAIKYKKQYGEVHERYLQAGEHCKSNFCKARATCPALARLVTDALGADFDALPALEAKVPTDLADLGKKNAVVDLIQDWCKQVRAKVEAALFEHKNSAEAIAALGFKLVQGKKGARAWSDVAEAETLMKKSFRLKNENMYDMTLKSPTSIEKLAPKLDKDGNVKPGQSPDLPLKLVQWEKLQKLVKQSEGQPSVQPADDKRPALSIETPTADDFNVVPTGAEDMV